MPLSSSARYDDNAVSFVVRNISMRRPIEKASCGGAPGFVVFLDGSAAIASVWSM